MNRKERLIAQLTAIFLLACVLAYGQDLRGRVTVNKTRPLRGAVVKLELPNRTIVLTTDEKGQFEAKGATANSVLVNVLYDDQLVYRVRRSLTPGVLLEIDLTGSSPAPEGFEPVALAAAGQDELYIADRQDRLYRYRDGQFSVIVKNQRFNDLAAGELEGRSAVFVCEQSGTGFSRLSWYDSEGKSKGAWQVGGALGTGCASVALDIASKTVYFGIARPAAIQKLDLSSRKTAHLAELGRALNVQELGPLAVDRANSRIFIADAPTGRILALALQGVKQSIFAHGLGEIRALAVDHKRNRLYAADVARHKIWQFDLNARSPAAKDFASGLPMKIPQALAVDSKGVVWVGDAGTHALLAISPEGTLLFTVGSR